MGIGANWGAARQRIAVALFGLAVGVGLLEIGVRLVGCGLLWRQKVANRAALAQKGAYRVLCLGDSMTAGHYPELLGQALRRRVRDRTITVIDRARPRVTAGIVLAELAENLDTYRPDMVVVMVGFNPVGQPLAYGGIPPMADSPSKLFDLLRVLLYNLRHRGEAERASSTGGPHPPGRGEPVDVCWFDPDSRQIADLPPGCQQYHRGEELRDAGQFDEAAEAFRQALERDPTLVVALVALGEWHATAGRCQQAVPLFRRAIAADSRAEWAYIGLADCHRRRGEVAAVERVLLEAVRAVPRRPLPPITLGWWYREQGNLARAVAVVSRGVEALPNNDQLLGVLGFLQHEAGRDKEARRLRARVRRQRLHRGDPVTRRDYREIAREVSRRGIRLVSVQYPMRSVEPLKRTLAPIPGVIFVDNDQIFRRAVHRGRYRDYFIDMFGGDFGHFAPAGNRLIAENIAAVIDREVFGQK